MATTSILSFGPYHLDLGAALLKRGSQEVKITPKALAVLRLFLTRLGEVVTKDDLFQTVWPGTVVSDDALTSCIQELRRALRDTAARPRYLETAYRRGFRFIGKVVSRQQAGASSQEETRGRGRVTSPTSPQASSLKPLAPTLVGRERELEQLNGWLETALAGERQLVFVTGEPGIGKTTLVETFLRSLESKVQRLESREERQNSKGNRQKAKSKVASPSPSLQPPTPVFIGREQCIEHHGAGEGYLPVLEALGRLCREAESPLVIEVLRQQAPTWLAQMPALLSTVELEALQPRIQGATRDRMLRELTDALEVLTAQHSLVLWLEDLQWSDVSTLDFLSALARRRERCRLLVLGTYRPVDVFVREHPLRAIKQELQLYRHCQELVLDFLSEEAVHAYLTARFAVPASEAASLRRLAHLIYQRTDGNPLFMVNVVEHFLVQRVIEHTDGQWTVHTGLATAAVPESLRQMIEQRLAQLSPSERTVLEVASIEGVEFSVATVAAGVEAPVETVEEQCRDLARQEQFLRAKGTATRPDGAVSECYRFRHALYQEVLYERLSTSRRQRLHRQLGERLEHGYGERAAEIAAELARHFEQGREYPRAVQYLKDAADNAVRRHAYHETIALLTQGLTLLQDLPETSARWRQEFTLRMRLSPVLIATKGYAAPEVEDMQTKALALGRQIGDDRYVFRVLSALLGFYMFRGNLQKARECGKQCLDMGRKIPSAGALLSSHHFLGVTLMCLGEFVAARSHLEEATALYELQPPDSRAFRGGDDPGVGCHLIMGLLLWFLGYPDQALRNSREALALAHKLAYPLTLASAFYLTGMLHELRGEGEIVQERAEALIALATEHGTFPYRLAGGRILRGRTLAEQGDGEGGLAQIRCGLTSWESPGSVILQSYALTVLAEMYLKIGQHDKGLAAVTDALALVNTNGDRWYEAELYRLKGELLMAQEAPKGRIEEVEQCFLKAIAVAHHQQAKSLELRAVVSLARLWRQQGKKAAAHHLLEGIYSWFTEGFDTRDLQEARALLEELRADVEVVFSNC